MNLQHAKIQLIPTINIFTLVYWETNFNKMLSVCAIELLHCSLGLYVFVRKLLVLVYKIWPFNKWTFLILNSRSLLVHAFRFFIKYISVICTFTSYTCAFDCYTCCHTPTKLEQNHNLFRDSILPLQLIKITSNTKIWTIPIGQGFNWR